MLTIEDIARAEGYAKAAVEVQERSRVEIDAAYERGVSDGIAGCAGAGPVAMLVGALAGAMVTGLIVWLV